jgi:hypothetical protein
MYGRPKIEDHDPAGGKMAMAAKVDSDMPASYESGAEHDRNGTAKTWGRDSEDDESEGMMGGGRAE